MNNGFEGAVNLLCVLMFILQRSVGLKRTSNIYHCVEPSVVALQFHTVSQQVVETDSWEMKPATVNIFTDQQLHGYFGKTYKGSVESENGLQHEVLSVAVKKLEGMLLCHALRLNAVS